MKSLRYEIDTNKIYKTVYFVERMRDTQVFMSNPAADALPVKYDSYSKREDFTALIAKLPEVTRIGFVFDTDKLDNKMFLESEPYFTPGDIKEGQTEFSKNVQLLRNLPGHIKSIDFLCCNTTKNSSWVKYYELLPQTIGASDDQTGNINGNWKMETTGEDVKNIYFGPGISKYAGTLIFNGYNFNISGAYPIELKHNCVLKSKDFEELGTNNYFKVVKPIKISLKGQISITSANQCIVIESDNVKISGHKKSSILVTVSGRNSYPGLIMNGDGNDHTRSYSGIIVSNITVDKNSTGLGSCAGWVAQANYGFASKNNLFIKCVNYAKLIRDGSGGIIGALSTCDITRCKNYGEIADRSDIVGGIIGSGAVNCNISKCVNKGSITSSGDANGGLCGGEGPGSNSSNLTFTKCVNKGDITLSGATSGGLCGSGNYLTFTKCANKGTITLTGGQTNGGLCGGTSSYLSFTKCINKGAIKSTNGGGNGGLCGGGGSSSTFTQCINTGDLELSNSGSNGGLCGGLVASVAITKCKNTGKIKSSNSSINNGGICGGGGGRRSQFSDNIQISNTINTGEILQSDTNSTGNAGFIGGLSRYTTITNSYNTGKIIGGTKNAAFIGDIDTCEYMSLSHSYSTYEPLVDIIPSNKLLIDTTKVSKKEGKWDSHSAAKCLVDGWVKYKNSHKPWGIAF